MTGPRERQPSQTTSAAKPPSTAQLTDEIPSEVGFIRELYARLIVVSL